MEVILLERVAKLGQMGEVVQKGASIPAAMNISLAILALAIVVIGLWPSIMTWLTAPAGQTFLSMFGQ